MRERIKRISLGVLIGLVILTGVGWLLTKTLGNHPETLYAGKPIGYWQQQLNSHDTEASNQALATIRGVVIPQLVDQMFQDTNDSKLRLTLIEVLNGLPGVQIYFPEADARRSLAVDHLGDLGPVAKEAVPALIKALKGQDAAIRRVVISSLGKIRSDPEIVIPLLIPYLEDDALDVAAAGALAEFGSLAKPAVPKLLPLLRAKDDDDQAAGKEALEKIDPVAAAKAEEELRNELLGNASTNRPAVAPKADPK